MKKRSKKLKKYMSNVKIMDNSVKHYTLNTILVSFGVLALCYMFLLSSMVFNITERRSLEKEALSLSKEVGDLGLTYLSLSNKIDLSLSYALGFKEIKPKFATRQTLGFDSSSLNIKLDNEI